MEFLLFLHVLGRPDHHSSRLQWAENQLNQWPDQLKKELQYYYTMSDEFLHIMDFISPVKHSLYPSVQSGLEILERMEQTEFIHYMLGPGYQLKIIHQWMRGEKNDLYESLKPEQKDLIKKPGKTKQKFMWFLHQSLSYFLMEQRRVEPWIIRCIHEIQENLSKDPIHFLSQVHPRLHVHSTYLELHKSKTYRFYYHETNKIYLTPSSFVYPHLLLGIYGDNLTIGYHVNVPGDTEKLSVPRDLIKLMKALSDSTRAAILKSLLKHPYCIQQLSDLHGISEPAVTKHVKVLKEANLVWSERRGHFVFYHGDVSRLEMVSVDLHQFIDMKE